MTQQDAAMGARTMPGSWYLVPPTEYDLPNAHGTHETRPPWRAIKRQPLAQSQQRKEA